MSDSSLQSTLAVIASSLAIRSLMSDAKDSTMSATNCGEYLHSPPCAGLPTAARSVRERRFHTRSWIRLE
jgi:hypothetical protein